MQKLSRAEYLKQYYEMHKDEHRARAQAWAQDNSEKVKLSKAEYYQKNKQRFINAKKHCDTCHKDVSSSNWSKHVSTKTHMLASNPCFHAFEHSHCFRTHTASVAMGLPIGIP